MSLRRRALFLAGLLAAVSCSDAGDPLGPEGRKPPTPEPGNVLQALDCTVTVSSRSLTCASAVPGTGAASGLIVGGQNLYVTLASSNVAVAADTFAFDATVKNLIPQALGVDSTGAVDTAEGVRVFFQVGPTATEGAGPVVVGNADGSEVFISGSKPYFQYAGGLAPNATSAVKRWRLALNGATKFTFRVYVSARVRHPQGWIDIAPDSLLLNESQVGSVAAAIRDQVGRGLAENVDWSSSNPAVATIAELTDSTAQVTGVAQGTAWIRAQSTAESVRRDSIKVVVNNAPVLVPDTIDAVANVTMPVDSANGMLANDSDDEPLTVTAGTVATAKGGTATLAANGSLVYLSKPGFSGTDTIHYTVSDGARTLPGLAVVFVEDAGFWYVKAGSSGDGRDASPFGTLAAAQDSAGVGDTIFVLANGVQQVDGAVTLEPGQALIGQGVSSSITRGTYNGAVLTVLSAGSAPGLTNTAAGATITLGTNNVIRGVGITAGAGAAIAGTTFGTLFVRETGVNPAGPALLLSTGALDAVFSTLSSTGSGTTGITLTDVTGSLTGTSGTIGGSAGTAFHVSGGSADITYGGSITNGSGLAASIAGRTGGALAISGDVTDSAGGISVSGISGGTVGFSGALSLTGSGMSVGSNTGGSISFTGSSKSISTGTNAAVSLTNNTGATVQFGGGGLAVSTTSGAGFTATGGGTVTVTGAGNTVASTSGIAVTLNAVGTGAGGVNLLSVTANGAPNGIVLSGVTGAGLQVTGDGATAGSGGTVQSTTGHAVSLANLAGADSVHLKFMSVDGGNGGNAGIFGSTFGTLRVTGVSVSTTGGPALSLATGTLNGGFSSLGSANSASNGVILTSTGGSFTAAAGSITGAAATAFAVAGGSVTATLAGSISQGNNALLLGVSGSHSGTLTFNGALSASAGTGMSFNDAEGGYAFNSTTTLAGGDAGVDITNGSGGTFSFGTGTAITSPTGTAFNVNGSSPSVTYSGNITKGNTGLLVDVSEQPGGTITFQTGTLQATAGTGLQLSNADGTVSFNGTTTLNGGDAGVDVLNNSAGTFTFGANASITNPTNHVVQITNSSPTFTYAGSFTKTNVGVGILASGNTGGTITFSGSGVTKSLSTSTSHAVSLTNNTGATVNFTGGSLAITTTSGNGFNATGGGTVTVQGSGNTISSSGGTALNVTSTTIGSGNLTFQRISATGGANGIVLNGTGTSGGLTVTGDGTKARNGSGGTVQTTTGDAVSLSSASNVTLQSMNITNPGGDGVEATGGQNVVLSGVNINLSGITGTAEAGHSGFTATNLSGTNRIDSNSIIQNILRSGNHGVRLAYNGSTSTASMTLDGSVFQNPSPNDNGAAFVSLQDDGTAAVTLTVNNSTLSGMWGSALVGGSTNAGGDGARTKVVVGGSTFQNAAVNSSSVKGFNNLELQPTGGGTMDFDIFNNTFQNVDMPNANSGFLLLQSTSGQMGSSGANGRVFGNTFSNIAGRNAIYITSNTGGGGHNINIEGNTFNTIPRHVVFVQARDATTDMDVRIHNNQIGTTTAVGTTNREALKISSQNTAELDVEVTNNTIVYGGTSQEGIELATSSTAANALNATVTGNSVTTTSTGKWFFAWSGTGLGTNAFMCLDLRTNWLSGSGTYDLTEDAGATFGFEGATTNVVTNANVASQNTSGTGNVLGDVRFNGGANCQQPSL